MAPQDISRALSAVISASAEEAFGVAPHGRPEPVSVRRIRGRLRYLQSTQGWWATPSLAAAVAAARADLATAGDLHHMSCNAGLILSRGTPLRAAHYRRTYGKKYVPPVDPRYLAHMEIRPSSHAAVALEQLRSRHLAPTRQMSKARVAEVTGWNAPAMPPPVLTLTTLRLLLSGTRSSSPLHG